MNIKSFSKELKIHLQEHYADEAVVEVSEIKKLNGKKDTGICIAFKDKDEMAVPIIYIEGIYKAYKNGELSFDECVGKIIEIREDNSIYGCFGDLNSLLTSWEKVKRYVYPRVINTNDNQDLLEELISFPFLDLSVIFVIRDIGEQENGSASIKITKNLFEQYGISLDILKETALENMKKDNYHFENLENMMYRFMGENFDYKKEDITEFEPGKMYVFTNKGCMFGATGILYHEMLKNILKDNDVYILPSSIHELLFVSAEGCDAGELKELIGAVNETTVEVTDRLSDHPYYYDGATKEIRVA